MPTFERQQSRTRSSHLASPARPDRANSQPALIEDPLIAQRQSLGNQAVQRMLRARMIQAKLTINEPGDPYEREADRVAEAVMRMPDPGTTDQAAVGRQAPGIQRMCSECEEELHRQPMEREGVVVGQVQTPRIRRVCSECEEELHRVEVDEEEEEFFQAKAVPGHTAEVSPNVKAYIEGLRGGGQRFPNSIRDFFEPRFGRDFGTVRLHTGALAAESARAVNARAYTVGKNIVFGAGEFAPETSTGRALLAHELVHTVQQAGSGETPVVRRQPAPPRTAREEEIRQSRTTPGGVRVSHTPLRIVIDNFAIDSADLKTEHAAVLAELIGILSKPPRASMLLVVIGHTDDTGPPDPYNVDLSRDRAEAVKQRLRRIPGSDIRARGRGKDRPTQDNGTVAGRSRNRRVEIFFSLPKKPEPPPKKPEPKPKKPEPEPEETEPLVCGLLCDILPDLHRFLVCVRNPVACFCLKNPLICGLIPRPGDGGPESKEPPDPTRPRACPEWIVPPPSPLVATEKFSGPAGTVFELRTPFDVKLKFIQEPDIGCYCYCGEYRQVVHGFLEENYGYGWRKFSGVYPRMANGSELDPKTPLEDAAITPTGLVPYGHRDRRPRGTNPFQDDEYLPRRIDGCEYLGRDNPGIRVQIQPHDPPAGTQYRFHLWFRGGPVDVCNGGKEQGNWLEIPGWWRTWECHGQYTIPAFA